MQSNHEHRSVACSDRLTRRGVLRVGGLTLSGLVLGDVSRLRAESRTRAQSARKSVIMIHLSGGPSHLDMSDMKPSAQPAGLGAGVLTSTRSPSWSALVMAAALAKQIGPLPGRCCFRRAAWSKRAFPW
jgi:hypothetical protein